MSIVSNSSYFEFEVILFYSQFLRVSISLKLLLFLVKSRSRHSIVKNYNAKELQPIILSLAIIYVGNPIYKGANCLNYI